MPSPAFKTLSSLVGTYLDAQKASEVITRQMEALKLNSETLSSTDLKALSTRIGTACSLYIADADKRADFKAKAAALG